MSYQNKKEYEVLKAIMKRFSTAAKEVEEMVEPKEQPEMTVVPNTAELSALVAQMASQSEALEAVQKQFAELSSKHEVAVAALAEIEAAKAALVAEVAAKQLAARKEKVELTVGTAKAPAILAATEALGDEQFNAIVAAFSANLEAEANSPMFKEVGVAAEAETIIVDPVAKLAANLAAQFNQKGNK